jgi:hypothetical protein
VQAQQKAGGGGRQQTWIHSADTGAV